MPFYGGLSRMVNRNDAAVVATGVNGEVVFRNGEFREGYGETVKSGRFLARPAPAGQPRNRLRLTWPGPSSSAARTPSRRCSTPVSRRSSRSGTPGRRRAVITRRAGVSVGALFRHFDTMGDFMAATAQEVMRRQLERSASRSRRYRRTDPRSRRC